MVDNWQKQLGAKYNRPIPEDKPKNKFYQSSQKNHGEKEMSKRILPLYNSFKKDIDTDPRKLEPTANTGLLFDKFCDHWSGDSKWKEQIDTRRKNEIQEAHDNPDWDANPKTWFLKSIISHHNKHIESNKLLSSYLKRRDELVKKQNGDTQSFKTQWRFVTGPGMGHVLETGFIWNKTLGVPYLPGSSIKGLIRSWVDPKKDSKGIAHGWGDPSKWEQWDQYKDLFGDGDDKKLGAGKLIVFDAFPINAELELDIMNPHYSEYYNKIPEDKNGNLTPPADYLKPIPIFFITVKPNINFSFALAPRGKGTVDDVNTGFNLLKNALDTLGAGCKTDVGYGHFDKVEGEI